MTAAGQILILVAALLPSDWMLWEPLKWYQAVGIPGCLLIIAATMVKR